MSRAAKLVVVSVLAAALPSLCLAQKIKVIVDQDARGPATTDMQSILIFLQSEKFDVLGITTVSGDQWVKEETQRTLRLLEIAGRTDVPVVQGAEFPLLNSKEETERWEALYGKLRYKGCWSDFSNRPANTAARLPRRISRSGCRSSAGRRRSRTPSRSTRLPRTLSFAWCISIPAKWWCGPAVLSPTSRWRCGSIPKWQRWRKSWS